MKITTALLSILLLYTGCQSKLDNQNSFANQKSTEMENEKIAIEKLLFAYRDALNASDTDNVLPLYTTNGVFMPSNAPTAIGHDQIKGAYDFVFSNIQLKIEFFIDEIEVHGTLAFARTTSKGTTLIHATGQTVPEENRELFVLQKDNEQWKIARYMFNKTK
ncbi:MAG: nuclear transport factor 2 family protein [Saprospiraceae bacterium]|nr:nuclear transport factor 2 family protein [Saprospiraceae bacterium]